MQRINEDVTISSVDREQHIINMIVKGCPVTAICSPQSNPEIYEQIRTILLGVVLKSPEHNFCKIGQKVERVDVYRGYQLKLKLNISVEQFLVSLENIKTPEQSFTA